MWKPVGDFFIEVVYDVQKLSVDKNSRQLCERKRTLHLKTVSKMLNKNCYSQKQKMETGV